MAKPAIAEPLLFDHLSAARLPLVPRSFHVRPMRHHIDSVNDCSRKGYNLRITCEGCGHVVEADTTLMMTELGPARAKWPLGRLEEKMKCSRCGERKSRIAPCAINF